MPTKAGPTKAGPPEAGPPEARSTIAVVGASARAAAFSLLRAGCKVVTADLFADADLARQCKASRIQPYPEGVADWLADTECDAWLYTGALENHPALIDRLSVSCPLLGHAGDVLRRARDPLQLQATLLREGFCFPETKPAAEEQPECGEWLGKTYRGSCGSGVGATPGATYYQRRVEGIPLSAVYMGSQLLGVTRQLVGEAWVGAGEFQYCGTITCWPLPSEAEQQLHQLGKLLNSEFELTDLYGVDLIFTGRDLWTIEINPRYTAAVEVVERVRGISVYDSDAFQGENACVGKVVLYAKAPLDVTKKMCHWLLEEAGGIRWPEIADIPVSGTEISVGQPILTLFATDESCETVEQRLLRRVSEIEQQLYGRTLQCV